MGVKTRACGWGAFANYTKAFANYTKAFANYTSWGALSVAGDHARRAREAFANYTSLEWGSVGCEHELGSCT